MLPTVEQQSLMSSADSECHRTTTTAHGRRVSIWHHRNENDHNGGAGKMRTYFATIPVDATPIILRHLSMYPRSIDWASYLPKTDLALVLDTRLPIIDAAIRATTAISFNCDSRRQRCRQNDLPEHTVPSTSLPCHWVFPLRGTGSQFCARANEIRWTQLTRVSMINMQNPRFTASVLSFFQNAVHLRQLSLVSVEADSFLPHRAARRLLSIVGPRLAHLSIRVEVRASDEATSRSHHTVLCRCVAASCTNLESIRVSNIRLTPLAYIWYTNGTTLRHIRVEPSVRDSHFDKIFGSLTDTCERIESFHLHSLYLGARYNARSTMRFLCSAAQHIRAVTLSSTMPLELCVEIFRVCTRLRVRLTGRVSRHTTDILARFGSRVYSMSLGDIARGPDFDAVDFRQALEQCATSLEELDLRTYEPTAYLESVLPARLHALRVITVEGLRDTAVQVLLRASPNLENLQLQHKRTPLWYLWLCRFARWCPRLRQISMKLQFESSDTFSRAITLISLHLKRFADCEQLLHLSIDFSVGNRTNTWHEIRSTTAPADSASALLRVTASMASRFLEVEGGCLKERLDKFRGRSTFVVLSESYSGVSISHH